jgi:hypothetical protein
VIRLELEAAPKVLLDCLHEGDELRLLDWLAARPELQALYEAALQIASSRS